MKVSFIWQGASDPIVFDHWNDGLRAAMLILEEEYEVEYIEPWDEPSGDVVFYWEAPCTWKGKNGDHYRRVHNLSIPTFLLFAGGPIEKKWVENFTHVFVESEINEREFAEIGVPHSRAFGVNTDIFVPLDVEKKRLGIMQATFAGWKRHELFADALGKDGMAVGRIQDHDKAGYNHCVAKGVEVLDKQPYEKLPHLLNESHAVVNTADYWGGGQRCTLEGLACGLPVIVMTDSPKNREYVEESGCGAVVKPEPDAVRQAVMDMKEVDVTDRAREYVMSKWTPQHYAKALKELL